MGFSRPLLLFCFVASGLASKTGVPIQWGPCAEGEFNTSLALQCGTLRVPLDYTQPNSSRTLDLEIVKIPAAVQPSKGSIQLNFGGPGLAARNAAVASGPMLQLLSGGEYDLLAFDPRGTGKTIPFICSHDSFDNGQMFSDMRSGNDSDTALRRLWTRGKVDGSVCQRHGNGNDTAEFIGTAFVARDLISVVDVLGEDGMLRYWGFSYGTVLGATVAAMFPERIDKLIIDGVANTHEYYHSHGDFEEWTDTDKSFSYFFASCIEAGPETCALATLNKTATELEQDAWAFFDSVREAPIAAGTVVVDIITLLGIILEQLKSTLGWAELSGHLIVLLYGSEEEKQVLMETLVGTAAGVLSASDNFRPVQSMWAIRCGDRTVRLGKFDEAVATFQKLREASRLAGNVVSSITAHCAQWPWHARETYMGDFQVKTKNPILLAGTTRDAHTPIISAFNVSSGFEGSGVLESNGTGHCTINAPSPCTLRATLAYWANGTLPLPGYVCDVPHPFTKYTWTDAAKDITGESVTSAEKREAYSRWMR